MLITAKRATRRAQSLFLAAALVALTSCGSPTAVPTPAATPAATTAATAEVWAQFTDSTGAQVTLAEKPVRVAVLFSSFADVWVTAGGEVAITVGESVERGFAAVDAKLVDGGAGKAIDNEALIAARPDFVICSADIQAQVETANLMRETGIPCAAFRVDDFPEYLDMLRICTDITGDEAAYTTCGTEVGARIDVILKQAAERASGGEKKDVLFIRSGSGARSAKAKTAEENFVCAMLRELGTYNIAESAPLLLDGLSVEEILMADPEYIFISTMGDETAARAYMDGVLAQEDWQGLTAVKAGDYAYLPKELFQFKPNAKWDEAYAYLLELLYPAAE